VGGTKASIGLGEEDPPPKRGPPQKKQKKKKRLIDGGVRLTFRDPLDAPWTHMASTEIFLGPQPSYQEHLVQCWLPHCVDTPSCNLGYTVRFPCDARYLWGIIDGTWRNSDGQVPTCVPCRVTGCHGESSSVWAETSRP
jgi:hypothetical protein